MLGDLEPERLVLIATKKHSMTTGTRESVK